MRNIFSFRLIGFGVAGAGLVPAANDLGDVKTITTYMAEPVTPPSTLEECKDDIKVKMELFIMKVQVHFYPFRSNESCLN